MNVVFILRLGFVHLESLSIIKEAYFYALHVWVFNHYFLILFGLNGII